MSYPTTAALVAASSVDELTALDGAEQDVLRSASISAVEEFCGQRFDSEDATETLDGNGSDAIYLPRRLESFDAVRVKGVEVPLTYLLLNRKHDRLHFQTNLGLGYYAQALVSMDYYGGSGFDGTRFSLGNGTVQIDGTWGWATCPDAVATAIRLDMEDQALADANIISKSIRSFRKMGLRSIDQGSLRADLMGGSTTLSEQIQRILVPYVWESAGALA